MAVTDAEILRIYPWAAIDHDNKEQWKGFVDHQLLVNRCTDCGEWINPPRPLCPSCWSDAVEAQAVSGAGKVQWFTLLYQGVPGRDATNPYPAVVVELAEQENLRLNSTIVECQPGDIACDLPLELVWQENDGAPLPTFRPADPALRTASEPQ